MRHASVALLAIGLFALPPATGPAEAAGASAGQAEAKEAARGAGCTPTKVDVVRHVVGREARTTFKVGCSEDKDAFVLVECRSRICTLMR